MSAFWILTLGANEQLENASEVFVTTHAAIVTIGILEYRSGRRATIFSSRMIDKYGSLLLSVTLSGYATAVE